MLFIMEQNFVKYIHEFFEKLVEHFQFKIKKELIQEQSYVIEYISKNFVIKIEKYFREFYARLYEINDLNNEINLFNLLEYLNQGSINVFKSEYFRNEKNLEECYRKQLEHISSAAYTNFFLINDFFSQDKYKLKIADFEKYWKNKHPELYK